MGPVISGKSRLVKYYNLARILRFALVLKNMPQLCTCNSLPNHKQFRSFFGVLQCTIGFLMVQLNLWNTIKYDSNKGRVWLYRRILWMYCLQVTKPDHETDVYLHPGCNYRTPQDASTCRARVQSTGWFLEISCGLRESNTGQAILLLVVRIWPRAHGVKYLWTNQCNGTFFWMRVVCSSVGVTMPQYYIIKDEIDTVDGWNPAPVDR